MKTNPYEYSGYDQSVPWIPQQNQVYDGRYASAYPGQQRTPISLKQRPQPGGIEQKPKPPKPMPKPRVLALASTLKRWLVAASLIGFGTFSGLAAFHQVGSIATASKSTSTSSGSSQTTSTSNSSTQNNNGFFKQQGGNNLGSSSSSSSTTSGSNSSSQSPVSGSSVS